MRFVLSLMLCVLSCSVSSGQMVGPTTPLPLAPSFGAVRANELRGLIANGETMVAELRANLAATELAIQTERDHLTDLENDMRILRLLDQPIPVALLEDLAVTNAELNRLQTVAIGYRMAIDHWEISIHFWQVELDILIDLGF